MARQLRILIVQGHRNSGGGNPAEMKVTPLAARAIQRALREAGHTADMLQDDSDWFAGSLDAVGREVVRRHDIDPYDIMLDIHFEGDANNIRGVFAIVPDGDGLHTTSPLRGSDSWQSNPLDCRYAEAIARGVASATGLRLRGGLLLPGVMSERGTGVGGQGYRLAMFGYTAVVRDRLVRLVLELGNIRGDANIIQSPGFYENAARGVVEGIRQVLESSDVVDISKPVTPGMPPFGHIVRLAKPQLVSVTADALNARKWAETDQPVMRVLRRGNIFWARGWVVGQTVAGNPVWWVMGKGSASDLLWRVWSGGTNRSVAEIIAMPTQEMAS